MHGTLWYTTLLIARNAKTLLYYNIISKHIHLIAVLVCIVKIFFDSVFIQLDLQIYNKCRFTHMIGCKYTHNVRSLPLSTNANGNEHTTAQESEFIGSRENFIKPNQETDPFATKELVC